MRADIGASSCIACLSIRCARVERDQKVRGTVEVQGTKIGRFPAKGDLPPMYQADSFVNPGKFKGE